MKRAIKVKALNWLYRGVRVVDLKNEFGEDVLEQIRSLSSDPKVGHLYDLNVTNQHIADMSTPDNVVVDDNKVSHTLTFISGETTCAVTPGEFCRFLYTKHFGTRNCCHLFDDTPLFEHSTGPREGWVARCIPCMKEYQ
jgi:hypothetical protein